MALNQQLNMDEGLSVYYEDPLCFSQIERSVYSLLWEFNPHHSREIVFVCIGTDRATGDCLGPLVGTRLRSLNSSMNVYGTLKDPAHATNLVQVMELIRCSHRHPLIVAVDACLGSSDRVGFINIKKGSLKPGTALKKTLPEIGDFYISGVVNVGDFGAHGTAKHQAVPGLSNGGYHCPGLYMAYSRFEHESRRQAAMPN